MNYLAINLEEKFSRFSEYWSPRIIARMNDYHFKLAKFLGDFVWHSHADTDEVFIVLDGALRVDFRDGSVDLQTGEISILTVPYPSLLEPEFSFSFLVGPFFS